MAYSLSRLRLDDLTLSRRLRVDIRFAVKRSPLLPTLLTALARLLLLLARLLLCAALTTLVPVLTHRSASLGEFIRRFKPQP